MGFFGNAMSVYAELVYGQSSIVAVQTLVVMVWSSLTANFATLFI